MKRTVCRILAGILLFSCIPISGCTNSKQTIIVTPIEDIKPKKKNITLWYYWEMESAQKALLDLVNDFNKSQEKSIVEIKYVPFDDFKKQLSFSPITSDSPDIALIDSSNNAYYANMGILKDITNDLKSFTHIEDYNESALNTCMLNERIYSVPFGTSCLALYYNEDMLKREDCEVPRTWQEFREVARKTTKNNVYGFGMSASQNEYGTFQFLPLLWSTGASTLEIGSDQGVKAFKLLKTLIDDGSMSKSVINWTETDTMEQFICGNIAMMINTSTKVPDIRKRATHMNWNIEYIPICNENVSTMGGENLAIINGDNTEESLEFFKYVLDKKNMNSYINDLGYISPIKYMEENAYESDQIMKKFINISKVAKEREVTYEWPNISDAIYNCVAECITGESDPETAAKNAQDMINIIVK